MSNLFRKEAIEAKHHSWLGSINVATPLSSWLLAGMAFAMAAVLIVFLIFGHYTRRARVGGELVNATPSASDWGTRCSYWTGRLISAPWPRRWTRSW
jgi:hypothetical protein